MTDEKMTEFIIKLTGELSALNENMKSVLDKLSNHEQRLTTLETKKASASADNNDWKVQLLMLLAKATTIGLVALAGVAGAGGILSQILP